MNVLDGGLLPSFPSPWPIATLRSAGSSKMFSALVSKTERMRERNCLSQHEHERKEGE